MGAYCGTRHPGGTTLVTTPDGLMLHPARSLELRNHSPTGFEWGYHGSGPAQLALALLLDATGSEQLSLRLYQHFKAEHVARWGDEWSLEVGEIGAWISDREGR